MVAPKSSDSGPGLPEALGRYRIVRLIGQGAMGRVLLAYDPVLDREVAVKHLRDDLKIPPEAREGLIVRMRHEARAAARVMHPHLVTLHDMGEDPALGLYLVFEYVEGPTLKQRLLDGPLDPEKGARLARELGAALTVAHSAGIVHRDIKPENIILSKSGGKIADFGIARIPDSTLTHAGGLMGTPAYSAPETFQAGAFSPESDQFSLAASMFEAISGKRAFPGEDAIAVASKIATDAPERFAAARGLPPAVDDVFARALAKKPADRFESCEAFGLALEASVASGAAQVIPRVEIAMPEPGDNELPRERKTGHIILGAAAVVVVGLLIGRAAMRQADRLTAQDAQPDETAPGASSAQASGTAGPKPRPSAAPLRPVKPRSSGDGSAEGDPLPGAQGSAAPAGPSDAGSASSAPDAGASADAAPSSPAPSADSGAGSAATTPTSQPSSSSPPGGATRRDGGAP